LVLRQTELLNGLTRQPWPRLNGIFISFQDITREKRAPDELNQMNQVFGKAIEHASMMAHRAEISTAAKSEFPASMSHEIRIFLN